ncbi:MAG: response regulator transcription factor [Verrucomicrobia bacterium]|nr:response regulator transcription factor [Verrucomicrobiota bacterium]
MKFVLVEDQVMFRGLIRKLLMQECKGEILLETSTLAELRSKFDKVRAADLLLLDIHLPDGDGISIINELSAAMIDTPVLLFSSSAEDYIVDRVRRSSAQGFVHKEESEEVLLTAIQNVSAGSAYYSPRFVDRIKQLGNNPVSFDKILSKREQELLCYLGSGYSDVEVAAMTGSKAGTIQTHRRNIMNKVGVHSAQELQAYALRHGFTTVSKLQ